MKSNKTYLQLSLPLLLIIINTSLPVYAEEVKGKTIKAPSQTMSRNLPGNIQNIGILRSKNAVERSLMISGKKYLYGINTKVKSKQSKFLSVQSLAVGETLGFNFTPTSQGYPAIYEIWVLPKDLKTLFISETLEQ